MGPGLGTSLAKRYEFVFDIKVYFSFEDLQLVVIQLFLLHEKKVVYNLYKKSSNNKVIQVIYFYSLSYIFLSTYVFYSVALSITGDASDISSLKNAFNTIRTKFGYDPEVLLYNPSVYQRSKLNILFFVSMLSLLY